MVTETNEQPQHLSLYVPGKPVAQGSTRAFLTKSGRPIVTGSNPGGVAAFRLDVIEAVRRARDLSPTSTPGEWDPMFAAKVGIWVDIVFSFERPKAHYGTGRNSTVKKEHAPDCHTSKPDIDKLSRAALDALTIARVFHDDSAVAGLTVAKTYADIAHTFINVQPLRVDPLDAARRATSITHPNPAERSERNTTS